MITVYYYRSSFPISFALYHQIRLNQKPNTDGQTHKRHFDENIDAQKRGKARELKFWSFVSSLIKSIIRNVEMGSRWMWAMMRMW